MELINLFNYRLASIFVKRNAITFGIMVNANMAQDVNLIIVK